MQNSNSCCQTQHVSKAKTVYCDEDRAEMVKIPRLQLGNEKHLLYKTFTQYA